MPPQSAENRSCYCVLYLTRALMLTFTRAALLWRAGTVLVRLQEGRGVVHFAFAGVRRLRIVLRVLRVLCVLRVLHMLSMLYVMCVQLPSV